MSIRTRTDARGRKVHQVRLPGERAATFRRRREAEKYELRRRDARAAGDYGSAKPLSLSEQLDGTIRRWIIAKQPKPASIVQARARAKWWSRVGLGSRRLDLLDVTEVEDEIAARAEDHPDAAKKELEWFKRALKDAQRRRQKFDPALLAIPPIKAGGREGIALDVDELQLLASWLPEHLATFPEFVGGVGLRIGEALTLADERVDLKRSEIFIPAMLNKEGRDKRIQLAPFERALLAEQMMLRPAGARYLYPRASGRLWSPSDFRAKVWRPAREASSRTLREKQNLPEWEPTRYDLLVPHDLRHTAISAMAAGGMRPEVIARRVGHADGGRLILSKYRHLFPDEMGLQLAGYDSWRAARAGEAAAQ